MPKTHAPALPDAAIGALAFAHLERMVAIDSQSDERSETIPTTDGQRVLGDELQRFWEGLGYAVLRDDSANVIAEVPGRGPLAGRSPVALLVHIDTARGTKALPKLQVLPGWDGTRIPYPKNPAIQVDTANYPTAAEFLGDDVVYGDGECPFGLDDKLGLAHLMTLGVLLQGEPRASHPPLLLIGRPDEEVGRDEAVRGLAAALAVRGVRHAYTIDGILPMEINVENFHAAQARVVFQDGETCPGGVDLVARIGGVNTHGATAAAEGHRAAPRLVAEWKAACPTLTVTSFASDALRDCDALVGVSVPESEEQAVRQALAAVMEPHVPRGATWSLARGLAGTPTVAADTMTRWVQAFYASAPGFTLPCEASSGRDGYTHPYRASPTPHGLRLDLRVRDFDSDGLARRLDHIKTLAPGAEVVPQYQNMGPRLAAFPDLVRWAEEAAAELGVQPRISPIRGGTGVDPFLDLGIGVANLGTGYFSPESEKEFTGLRMMALHARWLFALVQRLDA